MIGHRWPRRVFVILRSGYEQVYDGIVRVHEDREGNLRLFRKRGWWRQTADIFHPVGEWREVRWSAGAEPFPDGRRTDGTFPREIGREVTKQAPVTP